VSPLRLEHSSRTTDSREEAQAHVTSVISCIPSATLPSNKRLWSKSGPPDPEITSGSGDSGTPSPLVCLPPRSVILMLCSLYCASRSAGSCLPSFFLVLVFQKIVESRIYMTAVERVADSWMLLCWKSIIHASTWRFQGCNQPHRTYRYESRMSTSPRMHSFRISQNHLRKKRTIQACSKYYMMSAIKDRNFICVENESTRLLAV
jgi:hypothetical protein